MNYGHKLRRANIKFNNDIIKDYNSKKYNLYTYYLFKNEDIIYYDYVGDLNTLDSVLNSHLEH